MEDRDQAAQNDHLERPPDGNGQPQDHPDEANPPATEVELDRITVGPRHRKQLGDIAALARSIADIGLLQPLPITRDFQLVAGHRRLEALRQLGRTTAPVHVVTGLNDAAALLRAERDENICRLDLTRSEKVALGKALEELEQPEAKERQRAGGRAGGKGSGKLPEGSTGDTRDRVGAALGMSGRIYQMAKAVVDAAEADERYSPLVAEMDRTGNVSRAFRLLEDARVVTDLPAAAPTTADLAADFRLHLEALDRLRDEMARTDPAAVVTTLGADQAKGFATRLEGLAGALWARAEAIRAAASEPTKGDKS
jgi:ParB family chromosome partitioning protein